MKWKTPLFFLFYLVLSGCVTRVNPQIEPQIDYCVEERALCKKNSPFAPLTPGETSSRWGTEYTIGLGFGKQLDLYQTITAMKRSQILMQCNHPQRSDEADYFIMLSYYLGKRYGDVIETFCRSPLKYTSMDHFTPYCDMAVMLYDAYLHQHPPECVKADHMLCCIKGMDPSVGAKLELSTTLASGKIGALQEYRLCHHEDHSLEHLLDQYDRQRKSVLRAQFYNAILPGAGYWYVGQRQSAITAFLLNGLFIGAAAHFFVKGEIAPAIIFTSFEAGWYFGGILGAGLAAKSYNERVYEKLASHYMQKENLFPVMQLKYAF